ncbi:MAG: ribosome maturation factor RimM [Bacilli bacterium]
MKNTEELKLIGKIISTHGLKGEVRVHIITNQIERRFSTGKELFIKDKNGQFIKAKIKSFKEDPNKDPRMTLEGFDDINKIQIYNKCELYAPKLKDDDLIYLSDLLGMEIVDAKGKKIGVVSETRILVDRPYIIVKNQYIPFLMHVYIDEIKDEANQLVLTDLGMEIMKDAKD